MKIFNIDTTELKSKLLYKWIIFKANFRQKNIIISLSSSVFALAILVAGVYYVRFQQSTGVHAEGVQLRFAGANQSYNKGDEFSVDVYIDSKGLKVTGADIRIGYDAVVLQAESIQQSTFLPVVFIPGQVLPAARIVLGSDPASPKTGTGILATLKFKVIGKNGSTSFFFAPGTAISVLGQNSNAASIPGPFGIAIGTSNSGPAGTPEAPATFGPSLPPPPSTPPKPGTPTNPPAVISTSTPGPVQGGSGTTTLPK